MDIFEQIFSAPMGSIKPRRYYNVVLDADKLGFLKMFLSEQRDKLEEAFRNCESDDDSTSWDIEQVLKALDKAEEV